MGVLQVLLLLLALFPPSAGVVLLDNTANLLSSSPTGTFNSAGSNLYSIHKHGFSFVTSSSIALSRLDLCLNAASGGPYLIDFLVEVWIATSATALSPFYSVHAMGTVPAAGNKGYVSLVLPGLDLYAGGYYAVTFSPQTPSGMAFNMFSFAAAPTSTAGLTSIAMSRSSNSGASWVSGAGPFGGFRLGDDGGAIYAGTNTWTDATSNLNTGLRLTSINYLQTQTPGTTVMAVAITCPNDGLSVNFGITSVSLVICCNTGGSCTNSFYTVTIALVRATITSGVVQPTGTQIASTSLNPPTLSSVRAPLPPPIMFVPALVIQMHCSSLACPPDIVVYWDLPDFFRPCRYDLGNVVYAFEPVLLSYFYSIWRRG